MKTHSIYHNALFLGGVLLVGWHSIDPSTAFTMDNLSAIHAVLPRLNERSAIPMPIPTWTPPQGAMEPVDKVVWRNLSTGQTTSYNLKVQTHSALNAQSVGRLGVDSLQPPQRPSQPTASLNFGSLNLVTNADQYPWRVNCKLFMYFTDSRTGNPVAMVGTGVLIDAAHVLTAGHCVYVDTVWDGNHTNVNAVVNRYADSIIVDPGFQDNIVPYGEARSIALAVPARWQVNRDYDYDIGVIRLDRAVGGLTGWHAYAYVPTAGTFFQTSTFEIAGYPSTNGYNGLEMFERSGTFDDLTDQTMTFNQLAIPGQSGSGAYHSLWMNFNMNTVYGILSHSFVGQNVSVCTRIDLLKFQMIYNFVAAWIPSTLNIIPLGTQLSRSVVNSGQTIDSLMVTVMNYSTDSAKSTFGARVYLSDNKIITPYDQLLKTFTFSRVFRSVMVSPWRGPSVSTQVSIPPNTPTGNYYIGVILDNGNVTGPQDVAPVWVINQPTDVDDHVAEDLPRDFTLSQNYPNPFNPLTTIEYTLPRASNVSIVIRNVLGQEVCSLVNERRPGGRYSVQWSGTSADGQPIASGVYYYTIEADGFASSRKMLLLK